MGEVTHGVWLLEPLGLLRKLISESSWCYHLTAVHILIEVLTSFYYTVEDVVECPLILGTCSPDPPTPTSCWVYYLWISYS